MYENIFVRCILSEIITF
uniref:Uncharacterized protein n=1 Tax=Arundo donax TaxID=35708 RepID=A0A0A8YRD9_ARUDO